jgi:hypothetical protein
MEFRIGTHTYRVAIVRGWIQHDDAELAAQTDWNDCQIRISDQVPKHRRREILLHELRHAWQFEFSDSQSLSPEEDAKQAAKWSIDMTDQLQAQGGVAALLDMKADPPADAKSLRCTDPMWNAPALRESHECPLCQSIIPPGGIISDPATMFAALGRPGMERGYYCDFCKIVIRWTEGATEKGHPNGRLIAGPEILRGDLAKQWVNQKGLVAELHAA